MWTGRTKPCVKLCTTKFCPENQNNPYRGQVFPKAFLSKTNVRRALSLKSLQTTNNAQHTLSVSLARAWANDWRWSHSLKGHKNQGGVFVQIANGIPVLLKFPKAIHWGSKAFILSTNVQISSKTFKLSTDKTVSYQNFTSLNYKLWRVQLRSQLCSLWLKNGSFHYDNFKTQNGTLNKKYVQPSTRLDKQGLRGQTWMVGPGILMIPNMGQSRECKA